jgi:hypothetical protein
VNRRDTTLMTVCVLGLSGGVFACTGPVRLVHPRACPPSGVFDEQVPATLALPRLESPYIPPMPVPTHVHGSHATIRVMVDTLGHVMRDSVTVCGIADAMYAQRMAEEVSQLRFRPGLMNARHVVSPTLVTVQF